MDESNKIYKYTDGKWSEFPRTLENARSRVFYNLADINWYFDKYE